ncbi:MAG TPA: GNAT family N-acetyltransferase [Chitinophagaceae bacterium]
MQTDKFKIKAYDQKYKQQILTVWERSVLATHDFLTPTDFSEIKELVQTINFNHFQVYCLTEDDLVIGFIGVADKKIEMLFLDPKYFGQGLGKILMSFALNELSADKVDVNEQNIKAVNFYKKLGFEIIERTEKDNQGRNYPLLRMKLK